MANFDFTGYDNKVLAEQVESILSTKLDVNRFMTIDTSLEQNAGMEKIVHKYTCSADAVDDLARGEGNTNYVEASYVPVSYRVKRTQGATRWYDDDLFADPTLVDSKVKYVAEAMVNDWTKKAIGEYGKTENIAVCTNFDLADWADAIALYANKFESQEGLFALCAMDMVPTLRKALGDSLKYTEGYIKTGAIGDILGVPVYTSKAVPSGIIFLADNKAVTAFIKANTSVEQERNADTKENKMFASKYAVIALTDESRCIEMGKAQATTLTGAADVSDEAITGAATTGALVTAYAADGSELGHATAVNSAYSISSDEFKADDKIKVVAELKGYAKSVKSIVAVA